MATATLQRQRGLWNRLTRRVQNVALRHATDVYYRVLFGHSFPGAKPLESLVHQWELGRRGDVPLAASAWETQYEEGRWDFLGDSRELSRYSVLAGYILSVDGHPRVLDIGCGEGLLARRLDASYSAYLGVDLSSIAIERAQSRLSDERTHFAVADAERYVPSAEFDVVVFNESLYYFSEPLEVFDRYARGVTPEGAIALSMFLSARTRALLRCLLKTHPVLDHTTIRNGKLAWECCLFGAPAAKRSTAAQPARSA